ncbi:hypothetical protein BKA69DRAFT_1166581 [Paraphysoderma sedebokerense]|nr:hypothetical protein BKA69DRAFT_1166581 [Paraphysoderma sedebokerense]
MVMRVQQDLALGRKPEDSSLNRGAPSLQEAHEIQVAKQKYFLRQANERNEDQDGRDLRTKEERYDGVADQLEAEKSQHITSKGSTSIEGTD